MNWKSEERRREIRNATTDPWDIGCLDLAEQMGNWLEAGLEWRSFEPNGFEPDQWGYALAVVLSEWNGFGLWEEVLSPIEKLFVAPYLLAQIELAQTLAENQSHKGEADEQLSDLDK